MLQETLSGVLMPCLKHPGAPGLPQQQFPWAAGACLQTVRHREDRTIVFVDENGLSMRPHRVHTWAPRGQTPVLRETFSWDQLSVSAGLTYVAVLLYSSSVSVVAMICDSRITVNRGGHDGSTTGQPKRLSGRPENYRGKQPWARRTYG